MFGLNHGLARDSGRHVVSRAEGALETLRIVTRGIAALATFTALLVLAPVAIADDGSNDVPYIPPPLPATIHGPHVGPPFIMGPLPPPGGWRTPRDGYGSGGYGGGGCGSPQSTVAC
jgi:hypothetical protein